MGAGTPDTQEVVRVRKAASHCRILVSRSVLWPGTYTNNASVRPNQDEDESPCSTVRTPNLSLNLLWDHISNLVLFRLRLLTKSLLPLCHLAQALVIGAPDNKPLTTTYASPPGSIQVSTRPFPQLYNLTRAVRTLTFIRSQGLLPAPIVHALNMHP